MKTVFLLIGVNGSGRKTLLNNLNQNDSFALLTTISEGNSIKPHQIGIFSYNISSFEQIEEEQKQHLDIQFVTVGIDTVQSLKEQKERVNCDTSRPDSEDDFNKYLNIIKNQCAICINGDEKTLVEQVIAIGHLFQHGGVIAGKELEVLLKNGVLVNNAIFDKEKPEPASYNLHLGEHYFYYENDKQTVSELSKQSNLLTIYPYSYVIVETQELMNLPTFIAGNFDLTVNFFHKGIIMSASTQVDPGYKGALTCLLYNASDTKVTIKKGEAFLTIEYLTTSCNTKGYLGNRKNKNTVQEQLSENAMSRSASELYKTVKVVKTQKNSFLATITVPIVVALISCIGSCMGAGKIINKEKEELKKINIEVTKEEIKNEIKTSVISEFKQEIKLYINNEK